MDELSVARYGCSRVVFYLVCRMAWANCEAYTTEFETFSDFYDSALFLAMEAEIAACELLPGGAQITEPSEADRVLLLEFAEVSLTRFRYLERYIKRGYPVKATQDIMLNSAGKAHYLKAAHQNWPEMISLNKAADEFIADPAHNAVLLGPGKMPVAFPESVTLARTNFFDKQKLFKDDESNQSPDQQAKINAENILFDKVMSMLGDGIVIADGEPTMAHQFTYSLLVKANTGPKPAGCKGDIKTGVAHKAVSGVTCHIDELDLTKLSNAKGRFDFGPIAHGLYTIRFNKVGYHEVVLSNVDIKVSTQKTFHIVFIPL